MHIKNDMNTNTYASSLPWTVQSETRHMHLPSVQQDMFRGYGSVQEFVRDNKEEVDRKRGIVATQETLC